MLNILYLYCLNDEWRNNRIKTESLKLPFWIGPLKQSNYLTLTIDYQQDKQPDPLYLNLIFISSEIVLFAYDSFNMLCDTSWDFCEAANWELVPCSWL